MQVIDLGQMSWQDAWARQTQAHEAVLRGSMEETLFLVEHPHVVTLGRQTDLSLRNLRYAPRRARPPTASTSSKPTEAETSRITVRGSSSRTRS